MKLVQPIRDTRKIALFKEHLRQNNHRDYILCLLMLNTGLRVSDTINLTAGTVRSGWIREQKTGKIRHLYISDIIRHEVDEYIRSMNDSDYLFPSRAPGRLPHINRQTAYRLLKVAAASVGIDDFGTHSLRKTFGYHFYQRYKDVAMLQRVFGHSSPSITLRYIGIDDDMILTSLQNFAL